MSTTNFDYIIVGAGTAGCLLANRLSADPSKRVLLIEAGQKDDYHWIHIPVGYLYCIGNPRTDWLYTTAPDAGLNGRSLRYPRGKVLGGCSSINGMIYMRGQARDYDQWAQLTGDERWRWDNCLPFFKQHEDHHLGRTDLHGAGGEWRVERQRLRWDVLDAFAQAAVQAGIPATDDFNRGSNEGVGYFEVNQRSGWRWNTAKAFLRPTCYGRPNFELWTGAQVAKLLLSADANGQTRCTGVQVSTPQGMVTALAAQSVVLSAGAIGTPQILELSGIGSAAQLQSLGITPAIDLPGVGNNLQDHLQIRSVFKVKGVTTLNTLGVNINLSPDSIAQCIVQVGIGFMFAPNHHPAMKNVAPVRKELGVRTLFNILGPLTNPAGAPNILMGVFHADLVGIQVRALQRLGAEHALVVYGRDGLDEVSLGAATLVGELKNGEVREYEIHPEDFGLSMSSNRALRVDTPEQSRAMLMGVLDNQPGAAHDIVVLNAGAALYAANVVSSIEAGIARAREVLASGAAKAKLAQLVAVAHQLSTQ